MIIAATPYSFHREQHNEIINTIFINVGKCLVMPELAIFLTFQLLRFGGDDGLNKFIANITGWNDVSRASK